VRVHPSVKEGSHPGVCPGVLLPEGVAYPGCYTMAEQGHVGNPQSAVEKLAIL